MATEKNTGITQIKEAPLTVTTALSEGWYVLRSQDGYTDLDLFSTENGKIENIIAVNNEGKKLKGEARAIEYTNRYKSWDEINERYVNTNTILALSGEDAVSLKTDNGIVIRDFNSLFYEQPAVANPQDVYVISSDIFFHNNGKAHVIYGMSANSGRFGIADSEDYQLSPYRVYGYRNPLCFDEESSSFLAISGYDGSIEYFSDLGAVDTLVYPPVNNLEADLLYMGPGLITLLGLY